MGTEDMGFVPLGAARTTWQTARYPYLVVRLMPAVYSIKPLPGDLSLQVLLAIAWAEMERHEPAVAGKAAYGEP